MKGEIVYTNLTCDMLQHGGFEPTPRLLTETMSLPLYHLCYLIKSFQKQKFCFRWVSEWVGTQADLRDCLPHSKNIRR